MGRVLPCSYRSVSRLGEVRDEEEGGEGGNELAEVEVWEDFIHATVSGAWQRTILCDQSTVELLSFDGHFCLVSMLALYDSLVA